MKNILIPLPSTDFDPTEVAIPYQVLKHHRITFATPDGKVASGDQRMLDGNGLGVFSSMLKANAEAVKAYKDMVSSHAFNHPVSYESLNAKNFDALILPGGHAPGMKVYLEAKQIQKFVKKMNQEGKVIGAICHGVLVAARSEILQDKKVTALPRKSELLAWKLTKKSLGDYYRTYPDTTVEDEVKTFLVDPKNFLPGPPTLFRDTAKKTWAGFIVRDQNLVTARWPGDAHKFANEILLMLKEKNRDQE